MGEVKPKGTSKKSVSFVAVTAGILLIGVLTFGITFCVYKILEKNNTDTDIPAETENTEEPEDGTDVPPEEPKEEPVKEIDFQPIVDSWVKSTGGNKSVLIYDLDLDKIVGSYRPEENYSTASLYKLFPVYEGYRRLNNGAWDGNARAGSTGKSILECLDLAIRESNSVCAETLWGMIGRKTLNDIIVNEWGIINSDIPSLISNPNDITAIMQRFYRHPDFDDAALLNKMWDSFLNQPITTYNWRQGLPSGFKKASVYNKVGWDFDPDKNIWNFYHDAAIVRFPIEDGKTRDFVVVVMSNKLDFKYIRNFATMLENKFYEE